MKKKSGNAYQAIKRGVFMPTDVLEMELIFEDTVPKKNDEVTGCTSKIIGNIKSMLTTGPSWEFNPVNAKLYSKEGESFTLDDEKISKHVSENGNIEISPLDVNNDVMIVTIPVEILVTNVQHMTEDAVNRSSYHAVQTLFGKIAL